MNLPFDQLTLTFWVGLRPTMNNLFPIQMLLLILYTLLRVLFSTVSIRGSEWMEHSRTLCKQGFGRWESLFESFSICAMPTEREREGLHDIKFIGWWTAFSYVQHQVKWTGKEWWRESSRVGDRHQARECPEHSLLLCHPAQWTSHQGWASLQFYDSSCLPLEISHFMCQTQQTLNIVHLSDYVGKFMFFSSPRRFQVHIFYCYVRKNELKVERVGLGLLKTRKSAVVVC